jgi:hypothetical protein
MTSLVALHNLSSDKLDACHTLGGIPLPSLAVLPAGWQFGAYGKITLIAKPELADPAESPETRLFSTDVYSPMVPFTEFDFDHEDRRVHHGFKDGDTLRPFTMDTAMEMMRRAELVNGQWRSASFFPLGHVAAAMAMEFDSLGEASDWTDNLVPREAYDDCLTALHRPSLDVAMALADTYAGRPDMTGWDKINLAQADFHRALADYIRQEEGIDLAGLEASLRKFGFSPSQEHTRQAMEFLALVRPLPTPYFEAKIDRPVALGEFAAALIPSDSPRWVLKILEQSGIGIIGEFDSYQDRAEAVAVLAERAGAIHHTAPIFKR